MVKKDDKKSNSPYRHVPLWGPTRKTIKITPQNSGSFVDAVVRDEDGNKKLDAGVGDRIIVQRFNSLADSRMDLNEGIIVGLGDDGLVRWFDEVREQWFFFYWNIEKRPLLLKRVDSSGVTRQKGRRRRRKVDDAPKASEKEVVSYDRLDHPMGSFVFDPPMTVEFKLGNNDNGINGAIKEIDLPVAGEGAESLHDDIGLKLNFIWDRFCVPDPLTLDEAQVALRERFLTFARKVDKEEHVTKVRDIANKDDKVQAEERPSTLQEQQGAAGHQD